MNELALLLAVQDEVQAQTWTGSSNVIFRSSSVTIVPSIPDAIKQALSTMTVPFCLIAPGPAQSDPEHDEEPDLIRFTVNVGIFVVVGGDATGEFTIVSGVRSGGTSKSEGAGILRVEQEIYNAIGKLNALESVTLQFRQKSEEGSAYDPEGRRWIAYRILQFEGWGTAT